MPTPSRRPAGSPADVDAACMAEELECAVCRDVMCDPRVLSCQHVFCLRCIDLSSDRAQVTPGLGDAVGAFASDDDDDDAFDAGDGHFSPNAAAAAVSPSAHPSLHGAMFTASGGSTVTVKCPFGCGRTSVSDVRSLPRNVLITKLCQGLRERTHRRATAAGEPQACDMCCAEDLNRTLCGKCAAVLCAECSAGETHTFFCGVATRSFPFTIAWEAARAGLAAKLGERGVGPEAVRITRVRRAAVPCHFLQVKATTRIGSGETACTREVLVVADTSLNTTASATPDTFLRDCVEYFHVVSSASRSRSPSALSRIHSAASASLACSYGKQQAQRGAASGSGSSHSDSTSLSAPSSSSAASVQRAAFDACSLHQRDGAAPRPVASTQLSFLCKLQEVKARQGCLLRIASDLLAAPQLAQALRTPDVRGVERDRWGGGLANDVASLLGLLLTLYKQLCYPLYRKIRMLATLEGMRHHAASTHSAVAGLTPELSRRYRQEISTHLQMVFRSEAALDTLTREEDQLYEALDAEVQRMLAEQHAVYQQWRQGIASVHLDPGAAVLKGAGVRLRACPQAPGSGANVVTHLPPNGSVEYSLRAPLSGADRVDVWYAAPHTTSIRLVLGAAGGAEACTDVHVELASTGGWANFAVKTVSLACPLFGDAVLTLAKPAGCGADPPDVSRVTVSGACRSGSSAAAAAAAAATPQQQRRAGVPAAGHASPLHEQVLSILGFCHASQLDLLEAYDKLYQQCGKHYWGANMSREVQQKDAIIATDRLELLNRLKDIQQARIVQRQWFHCASIGFVDDGSSGASPDSSAALLPVIVVLPCSPHSAAEALPNLLQTLEPRIHEFREEQQHNMDAPLSHLQEQIRRVLWQTLELLQREQILQLREGLQQTKEGLVLHMAPGGTDLWAPLRPAEACVWPAWATGDVHELQVIQMLWSNAATRLGSGKGSDDSAAAAEAPAAAAADAAAAAAASSVSTPADVQVGGRLLSKIAMSLKKYAKAVVTSLEAVKAAREGGGGGGGGGVEGAATTKGDGAAEVLAGHLRVVVTLRDALAAAQASPSYVGRLKLLSQALFILRKLKDGWRALQAELGGGGGGGGPLPAAAAAAAPRSACEGAAAVEAAGGGEECLTDTPEADPVDEEGAALLEWFLERPSVERWHSLQENFGAAAECWDEADTVAAGGGGGGGGGGEKEVVAYDRAQIRDTAIALSKGRKGGEIAAAAAAAAAASSGGGAQEGEGVPSASLSLLLLYSEHAAPPNESVDMHVTHSIDPTDFQTLLKLPYYHGTYEVLDASGESTGVTYPFAVNGQDAVLHFACPPQSWGGWACSMLTAGLTRPLPYLAIHALVVALRWKG